MREVESVKVSSLQQLKHRYEHFDSAYSIGKYDKALEIATQGETEIFKTNNDLLSYYIIRSLVILYHPVSITIGTIINICREWRG